MRKLHSVLLVLCFCFCLVFSQYQLPTKKDEIPQGDIEPTASQDPSPPPPSEDPTPEPQDPVPTPAVDQIPTEDTHHTLPDSDDAPMNVFPPQDDQSDSSIDPSTDPSSSRRGPGRARDGPNLLNRGGRILPVTYIRPIFWGTSWGSAAFSSDKIQGIAQLFKALNGSNYLRNTVTEYTGTNGRCGTTLYLNTTIIDTSAITTDGTKTTDILTKVCSLIGTPHASGYGYYPVFVDKPRGTARFCAWHSSGVCPGQTIPFQFGFHFNLDAEGACGCGDTSGLRSQGLANIANVATHELTEAITDPNSLTWVDSAGYENADKCAWVYKGMSTLADGSKWKLQGGWSNNAYNAGTGYANGQGQKGCVA